MFNSFTYQYLLFYLSLYSRYLVVSLKSESVKFSYIGVPMNKEYALSWIDQIKKILSICCTYLEELHPESSADKKTIICFLHTLVAYTSTNTWVALAHPNFEKLRPGMNQLCANIMGHLVSHGFYTTLKVSLDSQLRKLNMCDQISSSVNRVSAGPKFPESPERY